MKAQLSDKISSKSTFEEWLHQVAKASPEDRVDIIESVILSGKGWLLYAHAASLKPLVFIGSADETPEAFAQHEFSTISVEASDENQTKCNVLPSHWGVVRDNLRFSLLSALVEEATERKDTGRRNQWLSSLLYYCGLLPKASEISTCLHWHLLKGVAYPSPESDISRFVSLNLQSSYQALGIDAWFVWLRQVLHPAESFSQIRCRLHASGWPLLSYVVHSLLPTCWDDQKRYCRCLSEQRIGDGEGQIQVPGPMRSSWELQDGDSAALLEGLSPVFFGIPIQQILPTLKQRPVRRQCYFFEGLASAALVLSLTGNQLAACVLLLQTKELLLQLPAQSPLPEKPLLSAGSEVCKENGGVWLLHRLSAAGGRDLCRSLYSALSFIDMYSSLFDPRAACRFAGVCPLPNSVDPPPKGEERGAAAEVPQGSSSALLSRLFVVPFLPVEEDGASWLLLERLLLFARSALLPHHPAVLLLNDAQGFPEETARGGEGPSSGAGQSPSSVGGAMTRIKSLGLAVSKSFSRARHPSPSSSSDASADAQGSRRRCAFSPREACQIRSAGELAVSALLAASWCLLDDRLAVVPCRGSFRGLRSFRRFVQGRRGSRLQAPLPSLLQRNASSDLISFMEFVESHTTPSGLSRVSSSGTKCGAFASSSKGNAQEVAERVCVEREQQTLLEPSPPPQLTNKSSFSWCFFERTGSSGGRGEGLDGTGDATKTKSASTLPECAQQGMHFDVNSCLVWMKQKQISSALRCAVGGSAAGCSLGVVAQLLWIVDSLSHALLPFSSSGILYSQAALRGPSTGKRSFPFHRQISVSCFLPFLRPLLERAFLYCQCFCPSDSAFALIFQRLGLLSLLQGNVRHAAACTALALRSEGGILRPFRDQGKNLVNKEALCQTLGRDGALVKSFSHIFMQRLRIQQLLSLRSNSIQAQYAVLLQLWQMRCVLRFHESVSRKPTATWEDISEENDKNVSKKTVIARRKKAAVVFGGRRLRRATSPAKSRESDGDVSSSARSGFVAYRARTVGGRSSFLRFQSRNRAVPCIHRHRHCIRHARRSSTQKLNKEAPSFSVARGLVDELSKLTPDERVSVLSSQMQLYGAVLLRRSHCVKTFATSSALSSMFNQPQSAVSSDQMTPSLDSSSDSLCQRPQESVCNANEQVDSFSSSQVQEGRTAPVETVIRRRRLELRMHALLSPLAEGSAFCRSQKRNRSRSWRRKSGSSLRFGEDTETRNLTSAVAGGAETFEPSCFVTLVNRAFLCLSASAEMQPYNGKTWALLAEAALQACHFFAAAEFARKSLLLERDRPRVWVLYALCFSARQSVAAPALVDRCVQEEVTLDKRRGTAEALARSPQNSKGEQALHVPHAEASSSDVQGEDNSASSEEEAPTGVNIKSRRKQSSFQEDATLFWEDYAEPFPASPVLWAYRGSPLTSKCALQKHLQETTAPSSPSTAASILTEALEELPEIPEKLVVLLALAQLTAAVAPEWQLVSAAEAGAWEVQRAKRRKGRVSELALLYLQQLGVVEEQRQSQLLQAAAERAFAEGFLQGPRVCSHGSRDQTTAAAEGTESLSFTYCRECALFAFEREEHLLLSTPSAVSCDWNDLHAALGSPACSSASNVSCEWPAAAALSGAVSSALSQRKSLFSSSVFQSLPCACSALKRVGAAMRAIDGGRLETVSSKVRCELHCFGGPTSAASTFNKGSVGSGPPQLAAEGNAASVVGADERRSLFGRASVTGSAGGVPGLAACVSVNVCFLEVEAWFCLANILAHLQQPILAWRAAQAAAAYISALERFLKSRSEPSDLLDPCDSADGGAAVSADIGGVACEVLLERVALWAVEVECLLLFVRLYGLEVSPEHREVLEANNLHVPGSSAVKASKWSWLCEGGEGPACSVTGHLGETEICGCIDETPQGLLEDVQHFRIKHPFHRGAQLLQGRVLVLVGRPAEAVETLRSACGSEEYCVDPSTDWQQEASALIAYAQALQEVQQPRLAVLSGARAVRLAERAPAIKIRQATEVESLH